MQQAAKYIVGGALLGAAYFGLTNVEQRYGIVALSDPEPEAFDVDKTRKIYDIFTKLDKLRRKRGDLVPNLDDTYRKIFWQTDKLLHLEKALLSGDADPDFEDGVIASSYADDVREHMRVFIKLMEKGPRRELAMQCGRELFAFIDAHATNVLVISETAGIDLASDDEDAEDDREAMRMLYEDY